MRCTTFPSPVTQKLTDLRGNLSLNMAERWTWEGGFKKELNEGFSAKIFQLTGYDPKYYFILYLIQSMAFILGMNEKKSFLNFRRKALIRERP
jgi:hypothetical protein